ncbi:imidazole glycerol phosphate synthase, glutamine amidotransferase subunit [Devosia insulae DS-56]|uniref:Imidazole glycerol phosphate synthase subunit HisH n=1 Tax=Devosia insulae DS-56 TaxID=1116389 RepID=A0A1E5XJE3_9HYPH|nr:imidazole glycerol phosphate synthase subunit HisH [Devosia insulae]OEO28644.1 imidazole glycerol phosphate synthase, glutamine amidotransferase subunit [Devosia insulae DS-56]
MIAIVDYGLGNIQAIANIYDRLGIVAAPAATAEAIEQAERIILPGVGSFDWAMQSLDNAGLRSPLDHAVRVARKPVLGICVGMQMMTHRSEEGQLAGLGWIDADVQRFRIGPAERRQVLPHMGWNDVIPGQPSPLMRGLEADARFYFLHSYCVVPRRNELTFAVAEYGSDFACGVQQENCYGVQFHPEKSHAWGVQLLRNFAELTC